MNKFYKLNVNFKPWWNESFQQCYPSKHVETILQEEFNSDYYEDDVQPYIIWKEIKNVQLTESTLYLEDVEPQIPIYIKYKTDEKIFYFYLYSKTKLTTINKKGKTLYGCVYFLDKYMTIYFYKLQILFNKNPLVKFNRKYCIPWIKIDENNYEINIVKKKELSSYINNINYELIRKKIFSITEQQLYASLNVPQITDSNLQWLKNPSSTGRYRYIVLKSSALISNENEKTVFPIFVKQTVIIVPIKDDDVLNNISNIDLNKAHTRKLIIGDNFIGVYECDIPFSYLYGLHLKDPNNVLFLKDDTDIYYFEVPINYYNRNILINYQNYINGFYGKLKYIFENWYKIIPETEIALLAPQYYREVYNNGSGEIVNDLSKFIFKWNKNEPFNFNLYITMQFNNELGLAYNYGENTNTQLAAYDNTNVEISNISVPTGLVGSAATQYYSNNINTALTSIQNRKLDQEQARRNKDFDCGKMWADSTIQIANTWLNVGSGASGIAGWIKTGKDAVVASVATAGILAKTAINTAQNHYNYIDNQKRANRELNAQINNIYSSPNINLANPFLKGVIPNNGELFIHYAFELHPYDKKLIFAKLLDEGYVYNAIDHLQKFIIRKYMNVLNIDPYIHYTHLLEILKNNDNSFFNTKNDFDDFFIWLAIPKKIYNTNKLINCLDWEEDDYIDNIYLENPPIPIQQQKQNIDNLDWTFSKWYPDCSYDMNLWKKECLEQLIEENDEIDERLWNYIDLIISKNGNIIIKVVIKNDWFVGETFFSCNFWSYRYIENEQTMNWIYCTRDDFIDEDFDFNKLKYLDIIHYGIDSQYIPTISDTRFYIWFPIVAFKDTKINLKELNIFYIYKNTVNWMVEREVDLANFTQPIGLFNFFWNEQININILNVNIYDDKQVIQLNRDSGTNINNLKIYFNNELQQELTNLYNCSLKYDFEN